MMKRRRAVVASVLMTFALLTQSATAGPVERLWSIADLVLSRDLTAPTRQELLLHAIESLLEHERRRVTVDLNRRVSDVRTPADLRSLLAELRAPDAPDAIDTDALRASVAGMLQSLPERPALTSPKELRVNKQIAGNRYVGIGIQLTMHRETSLPQVVTPLARGPAHRGGVRSGDLIVAIDGRATNNSLTETIKRLRGASGTQVELQIRQPSSNEVRETKLTRGTVPFETVVGYRRNDEAEWILQVPNADQIGYVQIQAIRPSTVREFQDLRPRLLEAAKSGLIIDLRFCDHHSSVRYALLLADAFLRDGDLGTIESFDGTRQSFDATPDAMFAEVPLVLLLGRFCRGGAEVFAAALHDRGRATLVGEPTGAYGAHVELVELDPQLGGATLTTARYLRASGDHLGVRRLEGAGPSAKVRPALRPKSPRRLTEREMAQLTQWRNAIGRIRPGKSNPSPPDPHLELAIKELRDMETSTESPQGD